MNTTQIPDQTLDHHAPNGQTPSPLGVTNIPIYANVVNVKSTENNISINFDVVENLAQSDKVSAMMNLVISHQTAYQLVQQLNQVLLNSQVSQPNNQELIARLNAWAESWDLDEQKESWECIKHLIDN